MRALTAAIAAALWLPVPSAGQSEPPVLTEAGFLATLEADYPGVAALAEEPARARAAAVAARTLANPELGAVREDPSGATEQIDLTLSWAPPHPGRRRLAGSAADAAVEAAERRRALALLDLRLSLREIYARWALAAERARRLEERLRRLEALELRARRRAETGEASGLEARRLTLAAAEAGAELARAEAERAAARAAVRSVRPELPEEVQLELPPLPPAPELAGTDHPRVAALEAELEAARLSHRLAGRVLEMPEVVAGWQRQEDAGGSVAGPIVGLSWALPLFERNRAEGIRAEARVSALEARLELARREVAAGRAGALAAYRRLRAWVEEARGSSAEGAAALEAVTAAFRLGEADLTDMLETFRSVSAAEVAVLDLHGEALAAHRELERAGGRRVAGPPGPPGSPSTDPETNRTPEGDLP